MNVFKDQVLVASAFLDAEKVGERALISLKLADGQENWRIPLSLNPWAGATVAGDLAIIGCSSIRLEPKDVPGAQGEVVVVSLIDGRLKWKKPLPAGIVSAIAIKDGLAVFTATDGCVRAWDVDSGQERWKTDPSAAYFASPAIAESVVYTADLKGKLRALNLKDGRLIWSLDLGKDPAIKAPGMVYGGPVVAAGKVYVATCNLDSASKLPTAVVCIGEK